MTDLATKPSAEGSPAEPTTPIQGASGNDSSTPDYAWSPIEPEPRKRHLGLWIGIPAGVLAVAAAVTSLVLIAPGTAVAGVQVGGMTAGAAADAIAHRLATTTIVLTGPGEDVAITGADLGASVDARVLASDAYAEHPMWNLAAWNSEPVKVPVTLNAETATSALKDVVPSLYTEPISAKVAFDTTTATYVVTPAIEGEGVDVAAVEKALEKALAAGQTSIEIDPALAPVEAVTPTYVADGAAKKLNGILDTVGFYVGAERTVPVDRAVAASWLTLSTDERGAISFTADENAIATVVPTLAASVDRAPVNATVITDTAGNVLKEQSAGVNGRTLGVTTGIAAAFATQLAGGNAAYSLPVTDVPFATTALARSIEVNLSDQQAILYENGQVVQSWYISSGAVGHETETGHFKIFAQVRMQDMGSAAAGYLTKDVPWVSYFNGDEALHGAYWHNNFGHVMSHGCVNMPLGAAEFVYSWATIGTEVWVHY